MTLTIHIPDDTEEYVRRALGENMDRAALDAIAAEGYRSGKLGRYLVQKMLGLKNYWEFEEWIAAHGLFIVNELDDLDSLDAAAPLRGGPDRP